MTRLPVAAALCLIGLAILAQSAQAHFGPPDNVDAGWDEWAARQYAHWGGHCCAFSHAHLYRDAYTYNPDGSVSITLNGQLVVVPQDHLTEIIPDDPNPTGNSVVWYDDPEHPYCFDGPGPLG